MILTTPRQQKVLRVYLEKGPQSSSVVHSVFMEHENVSLVTIKRDLSVLAKKKLLVSKGSGRSTTYEISSLGRAIVDVDSKKYGAVEPDKRYGRSSYDRNVFLSWPKEMFTANQLRVLDLATREYRRRSRNVSPTLQKKELERLIIELAWKSSRIEGNTYTLLDTEKLILENQEARGHDKDEARMILNHKHAFQFIYHERDSYKELTRGNLEELHRYLIKDLNVSRGFRQKPVGVTGSLYRPLENRFHIQEAVELLGQAIRRFRSPYSKAMGALLGISYIQPFEDGNKRTARLMANALLLSHRCAPLSYRSVDEGAYRDAMFVFYELSSIVPFRSIFIVQYEFAAHHYAVS